MLEVVRAERRAGSAPLEQPSPTSAPRTFRLPSQGAAYSAATAALQQRRAEMQRRSGASSQSVGSSLGQQ